MKIDATNYKMIQESIGNTYEWEFNNTGNSIRYTGIRSTVNEILGSPMCIFQAAIENVENLDNIKFRGIWDHNDKFRRITTGSTGKIYPGNMRRETVEKIPMQNLIYNISEFPEFQVMMKKQSNNCNGVICDYKSEILSKEIDMKKYVGILVYTENGVYKKVVVTEK